MRRASFKIQKVLDEVRERQAMMTMRERKMTLQRQKSGCENPFFPVQHIQPRDETLHLVTNNDHLELPDSDKRSDEGDQSESMERPVDERIGMKSDRARKYSVIMEEMEDMVGGRMDCEEIMQPIKHLSGILGTCQKHPDRGPCF